jgi:hypothetical protein
MTDFFSRGGAESAEGGKLDFLRVSASPREPLPRVLVCQLKRRSERRSAPPPGSATPATVAALPRVLVSPLDFFSRGGAESAEGGKLDFLRELRGSA